MATYVGRRVLQWIPVLVLSSMVVFAIIHLLPGDPAEILAGESGSDAAVVAIRERLGLDRPLPVQYVVWLGGVLRGDLGDSHIYGASALELTRARIPASLELAVAAALLSAVVGIPLGVIAAVRAGRPVDWLISTSSAVLIATPAFWVGILAIVVFSVQLGWLPPGGRVPFSDGVWPATRSLILPAAVLSLNGMPQLARLTRFAVLDVLQEDYVRTAIAKGVAPVRVTLRHQLRNALIPIITQLGINLGWTLGGAIVIETVFAWPGIGYGLVQAINHRDYAVVQTNLLWLVLIFLTINLVVDLLYAAVDPRIRTEVAR